MNSKFYSTLYFYLFSHTFLGYGQNLVPNPSFEQYTQCPEFLGSIRSYNLNSVWGVLTHWQANPPDCTPDYYHPCGKKKFRVPKNLCGTMEAKEGKAYVGMILRIGVAQFGNVLDLLYREHITAKLLAPLKKESRYVIQIHIVLSEYSNYAIGNIGALFTESPIIIQENKQYDPQVLSKPSIVKNKTYWKLICDTITAKGGEQYITIGNFDSYRKKVIKHITKKTIYAKKFNFNRAYYYIDQVSVEKISPTTLQSPPPHPKRTSNEKEELVIGKKIILENVVFEFDKSKLLPTSFPTLDKLVKLLKNDPSIVCNILGHTDNIGTKNKNQLLSESRAKSIVDYLCKEGISIDRLSFQGFGETQPISSNNTETGRQRNRRVELLIVNKD